MTKRKDLMFLVYPFIKCYLSTKKKKKKRITLQKKFYSSYTSQKMKFSVMDFFIKFLLQLFVDLVTFATQLLDGKRCFL